MEMVNGFRKYWKLRLYTDILEVKSRIDND